MIWKALCFSAVAMVTAQPVLAQPQLVFSQSHTEQCLWAGGAQAECIGASARQCMAETPGGETTVGMGGCLDREWQYWDGRLNMAYQDALARARNFDAENGDFAPPSEPALREMQRAWIPFRDARCGFEMSLWGGGTGGGPAYAECLMIVTAEQALYLETALAP
jgi:uncharacterized protein YecT (DUF1311 family)